MTIWVKGGIAALSVGTLGALGAYSGGLFENKKEILKVSKELEKDGFELLDTSKDDGWQVVLNEYKKPSKNLFPNVTVATIENLRNECSRMINQEFKISGDYSLAKQWCVKKEKISAILNKNRKKFLQDSDNEHWTAKISNLSSKANVISALGISKSSGLVNTDLSAKCKEIGNLETTSDDFLNKFELAKEWCSVINN